MERREREQEREREIEREREGGREERERTGGSKRDRRNETKLYPASEAMIPINHHPTTEIIILYTL